MGLTRRDFFKQTGCALGATAMIAGLEQLSLIDALAQSPQSVTDYKALVCIFLSGGNDCNNSVVSLDQYDGPTGSTTTGYANVRNSSGLAIPRSALLQINPSSGGQYGLHPNLSPEVANTGNAAGLLP